LSFMLGHSPLPLTEQPAGQQLPQQSIRPQTLQKHTSFQLIFSYLSHFSRSLPFLIGSLRLRSLATPTTEKARYFVGASHFLHAVDVSLPSFVPGLR
jgi:hypothetical protein